MRERGKLIFLAFLFLVVGIPALLFMFMADIAVLNPKGIIAEKQSQLLLFATVIMLVVVLPVFALTFGIAWKYRSGNGKAKYTPNWDFDWVLEALWWSVPLVIIVILSVVNWVYCIKLDPFRPIDSTAKPMKIQVVALQWKWLFIYPEQGIATVNYFQFPEQVPIDFEITADAPMNSFWIPQLGGQVYAMPGMKSELHLMADGSGTYRGSSSNISGTGFSGMVFQATSVSAGDFATWVDGVKGSSALNYDELVKPSQYVPQASYTVENGLFEKIIMKYMGEM